MGDLFDNFFGKIGTALNGGKSHQHYGGSSQVNAGREYNYHSNATNNKYWMHKNDMNPKAEGLKQRMNSVGSMGSYDVPTSRKGSVVSDKIDI